MDTFMEKLVEKRKSPMDTLITIGLVIAVPIVFIVISMLPVVGAFIGGSFSLPVIIGLGYGAYVLIRNRSIEYEYIVTNGDLDIDKIIAKRKRKRIISENCRSFDILAKYKGSHYTQDMENIKNRIEAVDTMQADDIYFFTFNKHGQKTIVFFQPQERMIDSMKKFAPRKIFKTDMNIQG